MTSAEFDAWVEEQTRFEPFTPEQLAESEAALAKLLAEWLE